jgi:hypothetical protein
MKTTIKKSLLVLFMLGTLINYGNNKTLIESMDDKKGHTLTIRDTNQKEIYSLSIKDTGNYSEIIKSTQLEDGEFTAELSKGFEIIEKPFRVEKGRVTFITNEEKIIFKPVIRNEGDLIFISKIAFDNQPLKIILYYNSEVIFTETLEGKDILERVYRLSERYEGKYKVVIDNVGRRYIKNISI